MKSRTSFSLIVAAFALSLLSACVDYAELEYVERPVGDIYNTAMDTLHQGMFREAAAMFDEVERQHPYSNWATKAQLMSAYSFYQNDNYDEAIVGLDRFIQLHPSNRDIAYAHYLKALSYYEQISEVSHDQLMTKLAMESLKKIIVRFPESKYARDSKLKLDLTNDHMAGKEMEVGRYYLNQGHYLAAVNRFKTVIDKYQTTTHVPEALHRLTESYYALGIDEEARKATAVLGHNFPGSPWYVDSYETVTDVSVAKTDDSSWLGAFKSEPTPRFEKMPLPDAETETWFKFWKPTEDATEQLNKKKEKTVVMKPAGEAGWYNFWKPELNQADPEKKKDASKQEPTPSGGAVPKKKEPWYVFW